MKSYKSKTQSEHLGINVYSKAQKLLLQAMQQTGLDQVETANELKRGGRVYARHRMNTSDISCTEWIWCPKNQINPGKNMNSDCESKNNERQKTGKQTAGWTTEN